MKTNSIRLLVIAFALCSCDRETPKLAAENAELRQTVSHLKTERSQQREKLGIQVSRYQINAEAEPLAMGTPTSKEELSRENGDLKRQIADLQSQISKERNELGRKLAETLLNQHLSKPSISGLGFSDSGFEKAEKEKLIVKSGFFMIPPFYEVTDKGMAVFGQLVSKDERSFQCGSMFDRSQGGAAATLKLQSPLPEKITTIDGIADAGNGKKLVEFTTDYIFPKETPAEITSYLYSGRKAKAIFVLYDDGWRVADEN